MATVMSLPPSGETPPLERRARPGRRCGWQGRGRCTGRHDQQTDQQQTNYAGTSSWSPPWSLVLNDAAIVIQYERQF
jgi:hypothetical protein